MKKLLVVLGLLVLVQGAALAQGPAAPGYYVDYFSNNPGPVPGAPDQVVRIINTGVLGTPLTSPVGDICADIYVFNNDQEMIACCAERITPNELDSASVGTQLTSNPLTSVVPPAGVIKIALTPATAGCNPTTDNLAASSTVLGAVFGTHLQVTGGATSVTETDKLGYPLSTAEAGFLQQACSFALYLGSGKGTCTSSVPGH
jgi:hypothetical protein